MAGGERGSDPTGDDTQARWRPARVQRPDQCHLPAYPQAQGGNSTSKGIGAHHDEVLARLEEHAGDPVLAIGRLLDVRSAQAFVPVAEPERGLALMAEPFQLPQGGVIRPDPLHQHLKPAPAGKRQVHERAAAAVDEAARLAVPQDVAGMTRNIRIDAAAREDAAPCVGRHHHLGTNGSRSAVGVDDCGQPDG